MDGLLGRVLIEPRTGLPTMRYFRIVREWEERQAARFGGHVRALHLHVSGGDERLRRVLPRRLCRDLRTSDLLAAEGPDHFVLLLTRADAEQVERVVDRVRAFVAAVNQERPRPDALAISCVAEPERRSPARSACETPDVSRLQTPPSVPRFEPRDGDDRDDPDDHDDGHESS